MLGTEPVDVDTLFQTTRSSVKRRTVSFSKKKQFYCGINNWFGSVEDDTSWQCELGEKREKEAECSDRVDESPTQTGDEEHSEEGPNDIVSDDSGFGSNDSDQYDPSEDIHIPKVTFQENVEILNERQGSQPNFLEAENSSKSQRKSKLKAKHIVQAFMSSVRKTLSVDARPKTTGMNAEVTDVCIVDESEHDDWLVLDVQVHSGALTDEPDLSIDPVQELKMTFITEHDFLDWVNIEEFCEKSAFRAQIIDLSQAQCFCFSDDEFECAAVGEAETTESGIVFTLSGLTSTSDFVPEVPIDRFLSLGYTPLESDLAKVDNKMRSYYDVRLKRERKWQLFKKAMGAVVGVAVFAALAYFYGTSFYSVSSGFIHTSVTYFSK